MHSTTSASRVQGATQRHRAIDLRRQGKTYRQIAAALGLANPGNAHRLVSAELAALRADCRESVAELRQHELDRLDGLWEVAYRQARTGDMQAATVCVKISARRAALLGLDGPPQSAQTVTKAYVVRDASPDCPAWPRHASALRTVDASHANG